MEEKWEFIKSSSLELEGFIRKEFSQKRSLSGEHFNKWKVSFRLRGFEKKRYVTFQCEDEALEFYKSVTLL